MIKYKVELLNFKAHIFQVTLIIAKPLHQQTLMMPCWIPGSYVIRDFSKQLSNITFLQESQPIDFIQTKSNEWRLKLEKLDTIVISYQVYAFDKSVRGAFLDNQRGFINGTSLFLCPLGHEAENYEVELVDPGLAWQVVTGLEPAATTKRYEFGFYQATNYAQLIDRPILMGKLLIKSFLMQNVQHDIAISGNQEGDMDRLAQDVQRICQTQVDFFKTLPAEVRYYCFLLHVAHEGYGGIEHVNSASLLINKFAIPACGETEQLKPYLDLLGLFSHEYFHLWMVKQIKPAVFQQYDLTQPNYTTQLWAFEGFTAYYDDLMLVRAALITPEQYFAILAENMNKLLKTPGRKTQTLKSASFDAWVKFYKPDENSINSTISYYLKGALLALCLDLKLRVISNHTFSLDNIMQKLWQEYGQVSRGVAEGDIEELIGQSHAEVKDLLIKGLETTDELPIEEILSKFGLMLSERQSESSLILDFGAKITDCHTMVLCHEVYQEGLFYDLGIQAGDMLLALQGNRVTYQNSQAIFQRYSNQTVGITLFREDKLVELTGIIRPNFVRQLQINIKPNFERFINQWLLKK